MLVTDPLILILVPSAPLTLIGSSQVPSLIVAAVLTDIHLTASVLVLCQPPVAPLPVGVAGFSIPS